MNRNEPSNLVDAVRGWSEETPDARAFTFLTDGDIEEQPMTFAELDTRARAIAALLQSDTAPGERALLVFPAGLEYITAFLGCLYASVVPVPTYPPRRTQGVAKLEGIAADCEPKLALTSTRLREDLSLRFASSIPLGSVRCLDVDVPIEEAARWRAPSLRAEDLAFLQYTSGSTAEPKGVMVTHGNLMHNERMIAEALETPGDSIGVSWLPVYHDMGLIGNVLQAMFLGGHCVLMSPHAFLQRPLRWLDAISRYGATTSGGPNFAYELSAAKVTDEQKRELDLSAWSLAFTGAEPIRAETLERFARAFEPCGFRKEAFYPCYGMAETTLFVSGGKRSAPPVIRELDADSIERHQAIPVASDDSKARALVGCGRPWMGQRIAIVDPETMKALPDGAIGEIWVSGESVARGYWGRPRQTEETFGARLRDSGEGPFLRTGDLGFLMDGELFVTGRLKDLIIIRGTNHYPQDIEQTLEECHEAIRTAGSAAFSIPVAGEERLVLVCEIERAYQRNAELETVVEAVRSAIAQHHQQKPHAIVLIRPGTLSKTSSGKIQRRRCREQFLSGDLQLVAEWTETPAHKSLAVIA